MLYYSVSNVILGAMPLFYQRLLLYNSWSNAPFLPETSTIQFLEQCPISTRDFYYTILGAMPHFYQRLLLYNSWSNAPFLPETSTIQFLEQCPFSTRDFYYANEIKTGQFILVFGSQGQQEVKVQLHQSTYYSLVHTL